MLVGTLVNTATVIAGSLIGLMLGNILPLVVPETEVQDIDTLTDWEIAEIKYRRLAER